MTVRTIALRSAAVLWVVWGLVHMLAGIIILSSDASGGFAAVALRLVAQVDNPDAVQAMLRHLGLLYDPEPDRAVQDRDREPQLELAYDFGA